MKLPNVKALPKAAAKGNAAKATAQAWLPIADLIDGVMITKDKRLVAVLRVDPAPFGLLSEAEQERRIAGLRAAYQSQQTFQVLSLGRPVDLDTYLRDLSDRQRDVSGLKRRMLRDYTDWVQQLARVGEALERRYYIVLSHPQGKTGDTELRKRADALVAGLRQADLQAHFCDTQEVHDLLFVFFQPLQAALEHAAPGAFTTLYERSI